jgi:hypothetical protein
MTANTAYTGGALSSSVISTLTAIDCTMTANSAYRGGAVTAEDGSTIAATRCTMTSNSARWGAAVYARVTEVGESTATSGATSGVTLSSCLISSNRADAEVGKQLEIFQRSVRI